MRGSPRFDSRPEHIPEVGSPRTTARSWPDVSNHIVRQSLQGDGEEVGLTRKRGRCASWPSSRVSQIALFAYEPYDPAGTPNASIGEFGLNINNGDIINPQLFRDYMSYCGPGWISLYHHGRLINNNLLDPIVVGITRASWRDYAMMDPNPPTRKIVS